MKRLPPSLSQLIALAVSVIAISASADTFNMAGSAWFNEGTEFPSVCMTFEPNGTLRFKGGYLYYNPSRWSQVKSDPELVQIRLGGSVAFPGTVAKEQVAKTPNGSLASFDVKRRLLVYRIGFGNVRVQRAHL